MTHPSQDPSSVDQAQTASIASAPIPTSEQVKSEQSILEKLWMSHLEEKKSERRWRNISRGIWLTLFLVIVFSIFSKSCTSKSAGVAGSHTAVVEIKGEIADETDASAKNIVSALQDAFAQPNAKAVVLLINSPGGSPVQAGIVNDEINRLKALYHRPIYAVVEESCASGAYYIAVAADKIFVDKASIVGSIGVLMDGFGFTGLMSKLGIERRLLTAGENKGFLDPFSPQTSRHKAYAQAMLDEIHQQFIAVVKRGRGARLKETPEIFSGLFWSGERAVDLGLADEIRGLDSVARDVVKAEEIINYTVHENVAEKLAKRFGASIGEGAVKAMRAQQSLQ